MTYIINTERVRPVTDLRSGNVRRINGVAVINRRCPILVNFRSRSENLLIRLSTVKFLIMPFPHTVTATAGLNLAQVIKVTAATVSESVTYGVLLLKNRYLTAVSNSVRLGRLVIILHRNNKYVLGHSNVSLTATRERCCPALRVNVGTALINVRVRMISVIRYRQRLPVETMEVHASVSVILDRDHEYGGRRRERWARCLIARDCFLCVIGSYSPCYAAWMPIKDYMEFAY